MDDLDQYINKLAAWKEHGNHVAFVDFIYKVNKQYEEFDFKNTDFVAAITVDRGDLLESLIEEGDVKDRDDIYFTRLEQLSRHSESEGEVDGWEPYEEATKDNWVEHIKSKLDH